ncbi:hypothetical protein [Brevundimonas sp. R86498]|uniref:hypothetical protein n=1 Tax=Brevundimonas sp. R86498 TaxID=3093845 RepID=UPI0037CA34C2
MSQLLGKIGPLDLGRGLVWSSVLVIRATGQSRRKVLFEIGSFERRTPRLTLQLDLFDNLSLVIADRDGRSFQTSPATPAQYNAGFPVVLQFEIVPREPSAFRARLIINGRPMEAVEFEGDLAGEFPEPQQSMGAALDGSDPGTFTVADVILTAPLPDEKMAELQSWLMDKSSEAAS